MKYEKLFYKIYIYIKILLLVSDIICDVAIKKKLLMTDDLPKAAGKGTDLEPCVISCVARGFHRYCGDSVVSYEKESIFSYRRH